MDAFKQNHMAIHCIKTGPQIIIYRTLVIAEVLAIYRKPDSMTFVIVYCCKAIEQAFAIHIRVRE